MDLLLERAILNAATSLTRRDEYVLPAHEDTIVFHIGSGATKASAATIVDWGLCYVALIGEPVPVLRIWLATHTACL